MKRILAMALSLLMVLVVFAGCTGPTENPAESPAPVETAEQPGESTNPEEPAAPTNCLGDSDSAPYSLLYSGEVSSLNYLIEGATNEQRVGAQVIDTLVEYDAHANLVPGLAETWEQSEDGLTWTFHLREGVYWYDYTGEPVAELTANDFVAAAKYVCTPEYESGTDYMILDFIEGAQDYYDAVADGQAADFATVGVKAIDNYTLQYTTVGNFPFFPTCLTYVCYMPAYAPQIEELGLDFGTSNDTMYYCGSYILTEFEPQVKHVYEKNYNNWDADNVFITKITRNYNTEAATLAPTMVLRGEVDYADISVDLLDEWKATYPEYLSKLRAVPDYSYFYCFNFRAGAGSEERIQTWRDNGWEPENWEKAVANANFRHAIMSAFNRDYSMVALEPDAGQRAEVTQRTVTPRTFTSVNGTDYSHLEQFANVDQYFYDEAKAAEYKAAAMEELSAAGVTFPVKVVLSYGSASTDWQKEVVLLEQQLESVLGTDFVDCVLFAGPSEGFLTAVRRNGMYGFMRCNWGADYEDPSTWAQPFAEDDAIDESSGGVRKCNSYNDMDIYMDAEHNDPAMTPLLQAYYAKVAEANAITDTAARYAAFAEAEAMLVENAVLVPYYIEPASYCATRLDIFEGQYAPCGVSNLRYKGQKIHENYVTMEEYTANYQAWLTAMGLGD